MTTTTATTATTRATSAQSLLPNLPFPSSPPLPTHPAHPDAADVGDGNVGVGDRSRMKIETKVPKVVSVSASGLTKMNGWETSSRKLKFLSAREKWPTWARTWNYLAQMVLNEGGGGWGLNDQKVPVFAINLWVIFVLYWPPLLMTAFIDRTYWSSWTSLALTFASTKASSKVNCVHHPSKTRSL